MAKQSNDAKAVQLLGWAVLLPLLIILVVLA